MGKSVRSRVIVPVAILLGLVLLILALITRWQESPSEIARDARPKAGSSAGTAVPSDGGPSGDAWQRPSTSDSKAYAIAFGRAIWTYDTNVHDFYDWQDAVSAFADPMGDGPRIAKSMLPYFAQWEQLKLHHAKAVVADVTAEVTPELQALEHSPKAPKGWHGYLVRGKQTSILDGQTTVAERQVTVGVVCLETCTFWSATTESPT
jgi:hypothetical protein